MNEKEILKKLISNKKNRKDYFYLLVDKIKKRLYVIAYSRLQNKSDTEDVIQETLFEIYKHINKLKDHEKFNSWITSILINKCNYIYKKNRKCIYLEENEIDTYYTSQNQINNINLINDKLDFYSLINCLPIEDRTLIAMFYSEEYTSKEISEILNINESTIRSRLKRSREKIKNYIKRSE